MIEELALSLGFAAVFAFGSIVLALGGYLLVWRVAGQNADDKTRDLSGSIVLRVAALHGLILALVFAQQLIEYRKLSDETVNEANAISDIFFDLNRFDDIPPELPAATRAYLDLVVGEEWDMLGKGEDLSPAATEKWNIVYNGALDLPSVTPADISLRSEILNNIRLIGNLRDQRANHGKHPINAMFWVSAMVGLVLVSMGYFCFPPNGQNIMLIVIFASYVGVVLFLIYSLENPFVSPVALPPTALTRVLAAF